MGLGPVYSGRQWPITPTEKSWAATVNKPIPQGIKDHHADQHAATHTQRLRLPGRYDIHGRKVWE